MPFTIEGMYMAVQQSSALDLQAEKNQIGDRTLAGERFLEENYGPDFDLKVNSYALCMSNGGLCMLGQMADHYSVATTRFGMTTTDAINLGFCAPSGLSTFASVEYYNELTKVWKQILHGRREKRKDARAKELADSIRVEFNYTIDQEEYVPDGSLTTSDVCGDEPEEQEEFGTVIEREDQLALV